MEFITESRCGAVYRARLHGKDVVVKQADVYKSRSVMKELKHEANIYEMLQDLQGICIPRLIAAETLDGMFFVLVTENVGRPIRYSDLSPHNREKIMKIMSAIHGFGILHNDIRLGNILTRFDGMEARFFIIDFGLSETTIDQEKLTDEMKKLKFLLDTPDRLNRG
jgi:tRNA A-37 threonylcarbamoyl transferase component Bud32